MAALDDVWRMELAGALRAAGILRSFAGAADVYAELDAATRAAIDRAAAGVPRTDLSLHPHQAAIAVLAASSRGPVEFAPVLAQMADDVPASWLTRASDYLARLGAAWSRATAIITLSSSGPVSLEVGLAEIERASEHDARSAWSLLLESYRALDLAEAQSLCDRALALRAREPSLREACESMIERAAAVVPGALHGRRAALLDAGVLYPPWLFREADDGTRDRLIQALETERPGQNTNHTLLALAWVGGDVVAQRLQRWSTAANPPSWRRELHVAPCAYAEEGGWWLSETGERRALVTQACRGLITDNLGSSPLTVFAPAAGTCPGCKAPLSFAVDLELQRGDLAFLELRGSRLRILTCERCTAFGPIYCEVTLDGAARWWRGNGAEDPERETWAPIGARQMWLTGPRAPTDALARIAGDRSQLGGHPSWEGDAWYPPCPACAKPMPCIGQLSVAALDEGDGFVYLFLDAACGFAATTFQQT